MPIGVEGRRERPLLRLILTPFELQRARAARRAQRPSDG
jgi:hypothetical protein